MKRPITLEDYDLLEEAYADMMHLAGTITDVLNHMSNDSEKGHLAFCVAMEREHRTLQQAFTRLCAAWLLYAAEPDYRNDLRNQGTHQLALKLKPLIEDAPLPFI
ncbi:MAG: hypothetical protein LLG45_12530 [Actinomycetia bacterium]|nr:hypothetical protein [Actinomycetes bacterium]